MQKQKIKNGVSVRLDDTCYSVEEAKAFGAELFKTKSVYEFNDLLQILLTPSQENSYTGGDTRRVFWVSNVKIEKAKEWMNSNPWRRKP